LELDSRGDAEVAGRVAGDPFTGQRCKKTVRTLRSFRHSRTTGLTWHDTCLTRAGSTPSGRTPMLAWTVTFLIIAIIAALLGFAGIAGAAAGIAKIIFYLFLILFAISLVFGSQRTRPPH
jgi:uncharacterized membrane protein YtjA (UPF0391 family)